MQGTLFRVEAPHGGEAADRKRPSSSPAADSSCSDGFKRARTTSSAVLYLLPLASDASTLDPRCAEHPRLSLTLSVQNPLTGHAVCLTSISAEVS